MIGHNFLCHKCQSFYGEYHISGLCPDCRELCPWIGPLDKKVRTIKEMEKKSCDECKRGFWAFEGDTICWDCRIGKTETMYLPPQNLYTQQQEKPKVRVSSLSKEVKLITEGVTIREETR